MNSEEHPEIPISEETAWEMARTFQVLADPTRVRILALLSREELSVGSLAEHLQMTPSAISHQLRRLHRMRLVRRRREGKRAFYTLDDEHVCALFRDALDHIEERPDATAEEG